MVYFLYYQIPFSACQDWMDIILLDIISMVYKIIKTRHQFITGQHTVATRPY